MLVTVRAVVEFGHVERKAMMIMNDSTGFPDSFGHLIRGNPCCGACPLRLHVLAMYLVDITMISFLLNTTSLLMPRCLNIYSVDFGMSSPHSMRNRGVVCCLSFVRFACFGFCRLITVNTHWKVRAGMNEMSTIDDSGRKTLIYFAGLVDVLLQFLNVVRCFRRIRSQFHVGKQLIFDVVATGKTDAVRELAEFCWAHPYLLFPFGSGCYRVYVIVCELYHVCLFDRDLYTPAGFGFHNPGQSGGSYYMHRYSPSKQLDGWLYLPFTKLTALYAHGCTEQLPRQCYIIPNHSYLDHFHWAKPIRIFFLVFLFLQWTWPQPLAAMWIFSQMDCRIGEADVPGPTGLTKPCLDIFHCNPTAVFGKVDEMVGWGEGVILAAETSATKRAQVITQRQFRNFGWHTVWSPHVDPYCQSTSELRGLAGGTAIFSALPVTPTLEPLPSDLEHCDRYVEAIVQYKPGCYMLVITIYGPTQGPRYNNPTVILNRLFSVAAQRALRFSGPSCIAGDFNMDVQCLQAWPCLFKAGWADAALLSSHLNGHEVEMTSDEAVRHSFVLISQHLVRGLQTCRTTHHDAFNKHPVLHARLDIDIVIEPVWNWCLPKSFDRYMHDPGLIEAAAAKLIHRSTNKTTQMISDGDLDGLAKQWTRIAEDSLASSVVSADGMQLRVKPGHFGRANKPPFRVFCPAIPIVKKPRDGDALPQIDQGTIELRRYIKQLHRLQSLCKQLKRLNHYPNSRARLQVQQLWNTIREAPGYHKSFDHWLFAYGFHEIPVDCPSFEVCGEIKDVFNTFYYKLEHEFRLHKSKLKQLQIIDEFRNGGATAFREIRDAECCPMTTVHFTNSVPIKNIRWTKTGTTILPLAQPAQIDPNFAVEFQGQKRKVVTVNENHVRLDHPVTLKSQDMTITQRCVTARPCEMLNKLEKSWKAFFQRDALSNPDDWIEADQLLNVLHDCPTMEYTEIKPQDLEQAIQGTKIKSARGSDGFSTMDLRKIPTNLWQLLCVIFHTIEQCGAEWPNIWMLAKTLCLPKVSNPTTPLDIRPVTILSKTYRLWSRIRGKQIAIHLSSQVPATIGGPSKGVAAEMIAMFSTVEIEHSLYSNSHLCGVVLDIVKCYNAVPRPPLLKALAKLGVNQFIITAFDSMLTHMERFFEISGFCGSSWKTDTGIVEGCSIAVSCMLAVGIWCDRHIAHAEPSANNIMFADNWAIFHHNAEGLKRALQATVQFVDSLKMQLSPCKSWLWATCNKLRQSLKNISVHDIPIPVVLHAKDLGVDQRYAKTVKCPHKKLKVQKTISKMKCIAKA